MRPVRIGQFCAALAAAAVGLAPLSASHAQAPGPPPFAAVENRMLGGGSHFESLEAAGWAVEQGPKLVPLLERMLGRRDFYEKRAEDTGGTTGAFPFNTLWALGRMKGAASAAALSRYIAREKDPVYRSIAGYALVAHRLRAANRNDPAFGVFGDGGMNSLYSSASEKSPVRSVLKPGQAVRVLRARIENRKEEGPRGGPTVFDRVRLLPSGPTGYVQRAGDGFLPFY